MSPILHICSLYCLNHSLPSPSPALSISFSASLILFWVLLHRVKHTKSFSSSQNYSFQFPFIQLYVYPPFFNLHNFTPLQNNQELLYLLFNYWLFIVLLSTAVRFHPKQHNETALAKITNDFSVKAKIQIFPLAFLIIQECLTVKHHVFETLFHLASLPHFPPSVTVLFANLSFSSFSLGFPRWRQQ